MSSAFILHSRKGLKEFDLSLSSSANPPAIIMIDIPDFSPKEIVNFVLRYEDIADVWIKTATLSSVSRQKWLKFKRKNENDYFLKRTMDMILGLTLIFLSIPLFLIVAILVKFSSHGGIFFRQPRVNNDLKIFNLYKFRTMNYSSDNDGTHQEYMRENIKNPNPNQKVHKLIDDPRITGIGRWIRRLSVDELPQLVNVVKGDMSLVGPRPPIPYEVEEYADWHYARFKAKPGLTGLWQATGRSLIPFEEMIVIDLYYFCNLSLWFDIKLLLQTIPMALSLRGAF